MKRQENLPLDFLGYVKRIGVGVSCLCMLVASAHAASLRIVHVVAPDINCKFDKDCRIIVNDSSDEFVLAGSTGRAFLQTRTYPQGEPGTDAESLFPYIYRVDLRELIGTTALPCVRTLSIDFGKVVPIDYDNDGYSDDVFVVTRGGLGEVAPTSAQQQGDRITFGFEKPVCSESFQYSGQSTFFFGLTSIWPPSPSPDVARIRDSFGEETRADVWVPHIDAGTVFEVDCDRGDRIVDALEEAKLKDIIHVTGICEETVIISTDRITLDGGGTAIIVGNPKQPVITVEGAAHVTLRGFTVMNGLDGIAAREACSLTLDTIKALENYRSGFRIEDNSSATIMSSNDSQLNDDLLEMEALMFASAQAARNRSCSNEASNNGEDGLYVDASKTSVEDTHHFGDCTANLSNNSGNGLKVIGGGSVTISGATVFMNNNRYDGMLVENSSNVVTSNNSTIRANNNGKVGIHSKLSVMSFIGSNSIKGMHNLVGLHIDTSVIRCDDTTITLDLRANTSRHMRCDGGHTNCRMNPSARCP